MFIIPHILKFQHKNISYQVDWSKLKITQEDMKIP